MGIAPGDIEWDAGDSPCDPNHKDGCKIRSGLNGLGFIYKCKTVPCDPEIAVDDGLPLNPNIPPITPTLAAGRTAPDAHINVYCPGGTLVFKPEGEFSAGQTLGWRPKGSNPPSPWKVTFEEPERACGSASPIDGPDGSCKLQQAGEFKYKFESTSQTCQTASDQKLVVK